ncbi:hypothetical protein ATM97_13105 [Nocardia sp. MH4]|uniref:hypothetical protein n=1 Tax=Nocardia sp. MH4 TaxID=1768677 RepID=UPI001C4E5A49|nr:hypothetical protein [Nocardia sp. MH4]MBW0271690.1 hypothetical protein [Nocardia sp. MH4]
MDDIELDLPSVASAHNAGRILEIGAVGLRNPLPVDGERTHAYVSCVDGTTLRLPDSLQNWAMQTLAANYDLRSTGLPSLFPCRFEFGIRDGAAYAIPVTEERAGRTPQPTA